MTFRGIQVSAKWAGTLSSAFVQRQGAGYGAYSRVKARKPARQMRRN
jgi:hypothetical protein